MGVIHLLACLVALLAFATPALLQADDRTARDIVQSEITDCTSRVLANPHRIEEGLDWIARCQQRAAELCAKQPNIEGQDNSCAEFSRAIWSDQADVIKTHLIQRWQSCRVPDTVKEEMIKAVEDTDAAAVALFDANCGYDAAQWRAFGKPDIAAHRRANCLLEAETSRAEIHFWNFIRDVGCENALEPD